MKLAVSLVVGAVAGCAADPAPTGPISVGGTCGGLTQSVASQAGIHVTPGTDITWSTNPPVTGMHDPVWGAYDRTYAALDRGYYLHDAERGAIVLLYHCPDGWPEVVARLEAIEPQALSPWPRRRT